MRQTHRLRRDDGGFSTTVGLISMGASLLVVAVLLLLGMNTFSGGTGAGTSSKTPSILSRSPAETQIKLCSEGRDSTYGSPPSSAQQATCLRELLSEVGGG